MRPLLLYLRSRSAPATVATMAGAAAALSALAHRFDDPSQRAQLALMATVAVTTAITLGLAGADIDLDRVAALAWAPRRTLHLLVAAVVALGVLLAAAMVWGPLTDTTRMVRDATGLTGLVALGTAALGAARAPALPLVWTVLALTLAPAQPSTHQVVLTWMTQPADVAAATVTAVVIGIAGTAAYSVFGPHG